jgi:vacuolar-type H+-ATPase subunit H
LLQFIPEIKKAEEKARDLIKSAEIQAAKALEESRMKVGKKIDTQRKPSVQMENQAEMTTSS